jgi:hypothetical protein
MWSVTRIAPSEPAPACPRPAHHDAHAVASDDEPQPGRALIVVGPGPGAAVDPAGARPSAVFLAQLIATAQRAPQTRRRRRAEPHEVSSLYAAAATPAARTGGAVCRSM